MPVTSKSTVNARFIKGNYCAVNAQGAGKVERIEVGTIKKLPEAIFNKLQAAGYVERVTIPD